MPYKKPKIEKIYYSISEVADIFDVNASLIRYWENEFTILKPKKNKKGNRLFTQKDLDNLFVIYNLVKERGYTLQGAKEYLKNNSQDAEEKAEVIKRLTHIKDYLLKVKENL